MTEPTTVSRRVLVTGASGGIGRAVCAAFAAQGDIVAAHYAGNREAAAATVDALPGDGHILVQGDLGDPAVPPRLVRETVDALGGVDVLVNNGAAGSRPHQITEVSYEEWTAAWERTVAVNLLGTANLTYAAARRMIDQGTGGRIVHIGSRAAYRGEPTSPAYGATKAAVHSLGQSLAVTLAPYGIGVASVAPGFVNTERAARALSGPDGDAIRAQSPFGRVAEPEEVAEAVRWLASPAAIWASGTVLDVNGASYLH